MGFYRKVSKKTSSIHNDFSYQKYINGSMATQERNTHTISKYVQVVCELKLYTGGLSVVPATQTPAQCNSRSRGATTGPGRCAVGAVNIQSQKNKNPKVCLRVGSFSLSEGVFMQRCHVKTKKKKKKTSVLSWAVYTSARSPARPRTRARQKTLEMKHFRFN